MQPRRDICSESLPLDPTPEAGKRTRDAPMAGSVNYRGPRWILTKGQRVLVTDRHPKHGPQRLEKILVYIAIEKCSKKRDDHKEVHWKDSRMKRSIRELEGENIDQKLIRAPSLWVGLSILLSTADHSDRGAGHSGHLRSRGDGSIHPVADRGTHTHRSLPIQQGEFHGHTGNDVGVAHHGNADRLLEQTNLRYVS